MTDWLTTRTGEMATPTAFYTTMINRESFYQIVKETAQKDFKVNLDNLLKHLSSSGGQVCDDDIRNLLFGDYMIPGVEPRIYDEITDIATLTSTVEK